MSNLISTPMKIWVKIVVLLLVSCATNTGSDPVNAPPSQPAAGSDTGGSQWYQVYFTNPDSPQVSTLRGGPDAKLAEAIRQTRLSVDIAMDNLDLWSVRDALIATHRKGITVRVVVESDNSSSTEIQELQASGIPIVEDSRPGLMHNKFVILDRSEVWTGSMNFTLNGAYRSDNNLVHIRSPELAQDYLVEFEEMFVERHFGPGSPANTPHPNLQIRGAQLQVYFSPDDQTMDHLLQLVHNAREEVLFLAYSFTDDDLAAALVEAAESGIRVAGVLDKSQALGNIGGEYDNLRENGIAVRLDGNPYSMHHKVIIIDGETVITGSYNFSNSAKTRNDENTLVIQEAGIAARYLQEFERVWAVAGE